MRESYDVVVIGSGIAGSALALVLKQAGIDVGVVERRTHPRFVIGESTVPTTSFLLKQLSADYDVPELTQIAHYLGLRESGCAAWPKQGFWYGLHHDGAPLQPNHEHMLDALMLPNGPDVHMLRADADSFLVSRFPKYGIDYQEHTEVVDYQQGPSGVVLGLAGPSGRQDITARLVIDCSGHASFLATRFGLRDEDARLSTNTRSIFGHFKGIPPLDELLRGCNPPFSFRRDATTMHHCFRGGWVWVIPFDTGVTSVGVQFDRDQAPLDTSIPPDVELARFLDRFPTMRAHLGRMEPVFPLIRTDRIQFTCKSILGDGFVLAPHAAGFIEPLFSTGILLTASFISRIVPSLQRAKQSGDWGTEQLRDVERAFFAEVQQIDRLVDGMIQSFRSYELFKQYWRNWVIGTTTQLVTCVLTGKAPRRPALYGAGVEGFSQHLAEVHALVRRGETDDLALAEEIKRRTEPWWEKLSRPAFWTSDDWAIGSPIACGVHGAPTRDITVGWLKKLSVELSPEQPEVSFANAEVWLKATGRRYKMQMERYRASKAEGSDYHLAYERILANQNPASFDYRQLVGLATPRQ